MMNLLGLSHGTMWFQARNAAEFRRFEMRNRGSVAATVIALLLVTGCASSDVRQRETAATKETLARPSHVIVYDFAGAPADLPPDSVIAKLYQQRDVPQTPEEIELGRQLGRLVSQNLVKKLTAAGIPAQAAAVAPVPLVGDAVIRGEFISTDEGSQLKRVLIGFGSGAAELKTLAEAYQVTPTGLRPLGSAEVTSEGGQLPGMLVSLGVGAATGGMAAAAAVGTTTAVVKETGSESLDAAAERTADEIAKLIVDDYKRRGWM
jgi:hypothetical protein